LRGLSIDVRNYINMKYIIFIIFSFNILFSQKKYPNLGIEYAYIENPDSNLINVLYYSGIHTYKKNTFIEIIVNSFGRYNESFHKSYINPHTDCIDTIKVVSLDGLICYFTESPDKMLILDYTLSKNIENINLGVIFNKTNYNEILELFMPEHVYAKTDSTIKFATFQEYNDAIEFKFSNNNVLHSIHIDYYID